MDTKVKKWGNSLGIRIPKSLSAQTGITDGTDVELQLDGNKITIAPINAKKYSLNELLSKVSEENIHYEINTNGSVGNEIW